MKKSISLSLLLVFLTVSASSLADFHRDIPNGKLLECHLCMFRNTPVHSSPALAPAIENPLPEYLIQLRESAVFQEIIFSSRIICILPLNRAPPVV